MIRFLARLVRPIVEEANRQTAAAHIADATRGIDVSIYTPLTLEQREGLAAMAWKSKLSPEGDVIAYPVVNITKKIVEIMHSYKSRPNNFTPL